MWVIKVWPRSIWLELRLGPHEIHPRSFLWFEVSQVKYAYWNFIAQFFPDGSGGLVESKKSN